MTTRCATLAALVLPLALAACASSDTAKPAEPAKATATPAKPAEPAKTTAQAKPSATPAPQERATRADSKVRFGAQPAYDYSGEGVEIDQVSPNTSAAQAGIQSGDILKTWNGKKIDDIYKWMEYLAAAKPGDVVDVGVLRKGQTIPVKVTLKAAE